MFLASSRLQPPMAPRIQFNISGKNASPRSLNQSANHQTSSPVSPIDCQVPAQNGDSNGNLNREIKRSRLRLRLPIRDGNLKERERSREKLGTKLQKLLLYTSHGSTINDVPHGNSSYQSEALLPENKKEQEARGRSPVREAPSSLAAEDPEMLSLMGFGNFGTTKGKPVSGNHGGTARRENATEYRQYMNRQKGFNRPLLPKRNL